MLTRPIPKTGEPLPAIGLGTWRGFDVGASDTARAPLREVLNTLFDGGGTVVDSSPMYGRAEGVAGDLLAKVGLHGRAFVATKVWTRGRAAGIDQMTESERLLRCGRIDLMQIHNLVDWRTQLATLRAWKEEGRIRYLGITHYTRSAFGDLAEVMAAEEIDFVQLPYSLALIGAEERLLPLAADRGIAVLVNRPFDGGALFGRRRARPFPDAARDLGCNDWAQLFLRFVLAHPAVTCVIPGTADPDHMRSFVVAGRADADPEVGTAIRELWAAV